MTLLSVQWEATGVIGKKLKDLFVCLQGNGINRFKFQETTLHLYF